MTTSFWVDIKICKLYKFVIEIFVFLVYNNIVVQPGQ